MRYLTKREDTMLKLKPEFQKEIFEKLINRFNSKEISKKLKKSRGLIYHYKNNLVKNIPESVVKNATKILDLSEIELSKNIIKRFSAKKEITNLLNSGRDIKCQKAKEQFKININSYNLLKRENSILYLNIKKWLEKNSWIKKLNKQKGLIRNVILKNNNDGMFISYLGYNRKFKKMSFYKVFLPEKLAINNEFCYFLGLLYGDGLNGARVGVVNKDRGLINWTSKFLTKYFPSNRIKTQLTLHKNKHGVDVSELSQWLRSISEEFTIYENPNALGNYVANVYITNNILRRILDGFLLNLKIFFKYLNFEQKGAFLAGFFDAEGNINKLDKNLRFSQKTYLKVNSIIDVLNLEGYHTRYDGSNIIIAFKKDYKTDLDLFKKQILPFMKHSQKAEKVKELLSGFLVEPRYRTILQIIKDEPYLIHNVIARKLGKVKCQGELVALYKAGFVIRIGGVGESFKYDITEKGLMYLGERIK